jgi:peptidoglycan/xylan/chitin deacetylase (PgdA/CDA1 family)
MPKIAYLTIDDGPSKDMKQKVDFLAKKKVPAIWFCRGDFLSLRPSYGVYAIKRGFILGNHAYSHRQFSRLPLKECFEEIGKTDLIIEKLYKKAGTRRPAKFFRFPYGDKGCPEGDTSKESELKRRRLQDFLKKCGYIRPRFNGITYRYYKARSAKEVDWYWTYDVLEYSIFRKAHTFGIDSLDKVFERMEENNPERFGGLNYKKSEDIILLHDHPESTRIFQPIINRLLSKNIEFRFPSF